MFDDFFKSNYGQTFQDKLQSTAKAANTKKAQFTGSQLAGNLADFRQAYPDASPDEEANFLRQQNSLNQNDLQDFFTGAELAFKDNIPMIARATQGLVTGDDKYFQMAQQEMAEADARRKTLSADTQTDLDAVNNAAKARQNLLDAQGSTGLGRIGKDVVGALGDYLANPRAIGMGIAENIDSVVTAPIGGLAVGTVAKGAIKGVGEGLLKKEIAKEAIGKMSGKAVAAYGIADNMVQEGASNSIGTYDKIMGMKMEDLQHSEKFQQAKAENPDLSDEDVQQQLALTQARKTAAVSGSLAAATGHLTGASSTMAKALMPDNAMTGLMGKSSGMLADKATDGVLKRTATGAIKEGLEETIQSGTGQAVSNVNVNTVDKNQSLTEGVGDNSIAGGLSGGGTGGVTSGGGHAIVKTGAAIAKGAGKLKDVIVGGKHTPEPEEGNSGYTQEITKDRSKFKGVKEWAGALNELRNDDKSDVDTRKARLVGYNESLKKAYQDKNISKAEFDQLSKVTLASYVKLEDETTATTKKEAEDFKQDAPVAEDFDEPEAPKSKAKGTPITVGGKIYLVDEGKVYQGTKEVTGSIQDSVLKKYADVQSTLGASAQTAQEPPKTEPAKFTPPPVSNPTQFTPEVSAGVDHGKQYIAEAATDTEFTQRKKEVLNWLNPITQSITKTKDVTEGATVSKAFTDVSGMKFTAPSGSQSKAEPETTKPVQSELDDDEKATFALGQKANAIAKAEGVDFITALGKAGAKAEDINKIIALTAKMKNQGRSAGSTARNKRATKAMQYYMTKEGIKDTALGQRLAGSAELSEGQRALVQALQSANSPLAKAIKNRDDVAKDIMDGGEDFTGLREYLQLVPELIAAKDEDGVATLMRKLSGFDRGMAKKAKTGKYRIDGHEKDFSDDADAMARFKDESLAANMANTHLSKMVNEAFPDLNLKESDYKTMQRNVAALTGQKLDETTRSASNHTVPQKTRQGIVKQAMNLLLNPAAKGREGTEKALATTRLKLNNKYGFNTSTIKAANEASQFIKDSEGKNLSEEDQAKLKESKKLLADTYSKLVDHFGSVDKLESALREQVEDTTDLDKAFEGAYANTDTEYEQGETTFGHRTVKPITEIKSTDQLDEHNARLEVTKEALKDSPEDFNKEEVDLIKGMKPLDSLSENSVEEYNTLADVMNRAQVPWTDVPTNLNKSVEGTTPDNRVFQNLLEGLPLSSQARQNIELNPRILGLIHTEENLMEKLADPESEEYKFLTRNLDADSLEHLRDFQDFYKSFDGALSAVALQAKDSRGEGIENYVLDEFFDENGKLPNSIKVAIAAGVMDYLLNDAGKSLYNDNDAIGKILGHNKGYYPTGIESKVLRSGRSETLAQETIGANVLRNLGIKGTPEGDTHYIKQLRANIGALSVAALTDTSNNRIPFMQKRFAVLKGVSGVVRAIEPGETYKIDTSAKNVNDRERPMALLVAVVDKNQVEGERTKLTSKTEHALEAAKDHDLMKDFMGISTNYIPPFFDGDAVPNQDDVTWLSDEQKEAVRIAGSVARTPDFDFLNIRAILDPFFRNNLVDNIPEEGTDHISNRDANKARRANVLDTGAALDEQIGLFKASGSKNIYYVVKANRSNKRMEEYCTLGSDQKDKLVRHSIKLSNAKVTLDMANPNHKFAFELAVTEALDVDCGEFKKSTDKSTDEAVSEGFQAILNDKVFMDAATSIASGKPDKDLIQKALGDGGETAIKLDGLIALSKFVGSKGSKFEVFTCKENDGITNGIAISLTQLANASSFDDYVTSLARVGIYTGSLVDTQGFGEWYAEKDEDGKRSNLDSYQGFGANLEHVLLNPTEHPYSDGSVLPNPDLKSATFKYMNKDQLTQAKEEEVAVLDEYGDSKNTKRMVSTKTDRVDENGKPIYTNKVHLSAEEHQRTAKAVQFFLNQKIMDKDGKPLKLMDVIIEISRNFSKDPLMIFNYGAKIKGLKLAVANNVSRGIAASLEQAQKLDGQEREDALNSIQETINALNVLPKKEFVIDKEAPLEQSIEGLRAWTELAVEFTYGPAMDTTFDELYKEYKNPINKVILLNRIAVLAYKKLYERKVREATLRNKGKFTNEMEAQIKEELKEFSPMMATALTDDRVENGLSWSDTERTKDTDAFGKPRNEKTDKVSIPIKRSNTKSGESTAKGSTYSVALKDPSVGTYAKLVQSLDATVIVKALLKIGNKFGGVHDAGIFSLLNLFDDGKKLNEAFVDMAEEYSIMSAVKEMFDAVLSGDITNEEMEAVLEEIGGTKALKATFGVESIAEVRERLDREVTMRNELRDVMKRGTSGIVQYNGSSKTKVNMGTGELSVEEMGKEFNRILDANRDLLSSSSVKDVQQELANRFGERVTKLMADGKEAKAEYTAKDFAKASVATAFVGAGIKFSSTALYAGWFRALGMRKTKFTPDDVVFVSANGHSQKAGTSKPKYTAKKKKFTPKKKYSGTKSRYAKKTSKAAWTGKSKSFKFTHIPVINSKGQLTQAYKGLGKAVEAGATILTDNEANFNRKYNSGEREVVQYLMDQGYVATQEKGENFLRWMPKATAQAKKLEPEHIEVTNFKGTNKPKQTLIERLANEGDTTKVVAAVRETVSKWGIAGKINQMILNSVPSDLKIVWHNSRDEKGMHLNKGNSDKSNAVYDAGKSTIHVFGWKYGEITEENQQAVTRDIATTLLHEFDHAATFHKLMKAGRKSLPAKYASAFLVHLLADKTAQSDFLKSISNSKAGGFKMEVMHMLQDAEVTTAAEAKEFVANLDERKLIHFTSELSAWSKTNNEVRDQLSKITEFTEAKEAVGISGLLNKFINALANLMGFKTKDEANLYEAFTASTVHYYARSQTFNSPMFSQDYYNIIKSVEGLSNTADVPAEAVTLIQGIGYIFRTLSKSTGAVTSFRKKVQKKLDGDPSTSVFGNMLDETKQEKMPKTFAGNLISAAFNDEGEINPKSELVKTLKALAGEEITLDTGETFTMPEYSDGLLNIASQVAGVGEGALNMHDELPTDDTSYYLYERLADEVIIDTDVSSENFKHIYNTLGDLPAASTPSTKHKAQLDTVVDMLTPTLNRLQLIVASGSTTEGEVEGDVLAVDVNLGIQVSALEKSPQEVLVHEMLHPFLWNANKRSKYYAALQREADIIRSNLKPEDFTAHLVNPSEADKAMAEKQYQHIVNNRIEGFTTETTWLNEDRKIQNSNPTEECLIYALTNESMVRAIDAMSSRIKEPEAKNTYEKIIKAFRGVMRIIDREVSGLDSLSRSKRITTLTGMLAGSQKKHESVLNKVSNVITNWFDGSEQWIKDKVNSVGFVANSKMAFNAFKMHSPYADRIRKYMGKWIWGKSKFVASVANELTMGRKSMSELLMLLTKSTKKVEQDSQNIKEMIGRAIKTNLVNLTSDESKSVYYGAAKTDISALTDRYSIEEIQGILAEPGKLNKAITDVQGELQKVGKQDYRWFRSNAEDLGYHMVTGGRLYANGSHTNSMQVAMKFGLPDSYKNNTNVDVAEAATLIDELASLYAIRYNPFPMSERFLNNADELEYVIQNQSQLKSLSMEHNFKGAEYNFIKGYIAEDYDSDTDVILATEKEGKRLVALGYTKNATEVHTDPLSAVTTKKYYYTRSGSQLTGWASGIFSLKGDRVRGTSMFPIHGVAGKTALQNSLALERMQKERLRMAAEMYKSGGTKVLPEYRQRIAATRYKADGTAFTFMHETSDKLKDTMLGRSTDYGKGIGSTLAGIKRRVATKEINSEAVEALYKVYREEFHKYPDEFVTLDQAGETFKVLPTDAQEHLKNLFGDDPIKVRQEQFDTWFGYRKFAIREMKHKDLQDAKGWEYFTGAINNMFFKMLSNKFGNAVDQYWTNFVKMAKDTIVIRSLGVTAANIVSNTVLLWMSGVPLLTAMKDTVECYTATFKYKKLESDLYDEKAKLFKPKLTEPEQRHIEANIAVIEHKLTNNLVHPLMTAGMYQTIVEDVSTLDEDAPIKDKFESIFDPIVSKLPPMAKTVGSNLFMTHGSFLYGAARDLAQISDFAARYSLHKHNTTKKGMSFSSSIEDCMNTFINYDMPTHKGIQALNDYGLMGFTKYLLRVQQVILKRFGENPARMITAVALQDIMGMHLSDPTDALLTGPSSIMSRFYDPMNWVTGANDMFTLDLLGDAISD